MPEGRHQRTRDAYRLEGDNGRCACGDAAVDAGCCKKCAAVREAIATYGRSAPVAEPNDDWLWGV